MKNKSGRESLYIFIAIGLLVLAIVRPASAQTVVGWGNNASGQATPPATLTNTAAISGGLWVSLGLGSDGTVSAFGDGTYYEDNVPSEATNVVGIAAGYLYDIALKADGTVVQWGNSSYYQFYGYPPPATNLVSVATWGYHALGLKSDGTVIGWGNNTTNQATPPTGLSNVIAIATGETHSIALINDGSVVCWGDNSAGQCSIPAGLSNVVAIAGGATHTVALKGDGTVAVWGDNAPAQLNVSPCLTNIVAVSAYLALRSDGAVMTWPGSCDPLTNASSVMAIASGWDHSLAITGQQAPQIYQQPAGLTVLAAGTALLKASAIGTVPLSYQWQLNGTNLPGATNSTLLLGDIQPAQAGQYSVVVSNSLGTVTSSNAALSVLNEIITSEPIANQTLFGGSTVILTVVAQGADLDYQWQFFGTNVASATNAQLVLSNLTTNMAGNYTVIVSNEFGFVTSTIATINVIPIEAVPLTNQTLYVGDTATFTVTAVQFGPYTYQWQFNGADIPGATNQTLTLPNLTTNEGGNYSVIVSNPYGTTQTAATLTVGNIKPVIITQPASEGVTLGGSNTLQIVANGTKPLSYQWFFNGTLIPGATSSTLSITNAGKTNTGNYSVLVSNPVGSTMSANASLSVLCVVTWGATNVSGLNLVPLDLTNVTAVACGLSHSVALKSNGKVDVWGDNTYGQKNVPANLSNVVAIAAANNHTLALKNDGTVASWGDMLIVPANVTNVIAVAAGDEFNMALRGDGSVVAWPAGTGDAVASVPVNVTNVVAISAGGAFGAALRADKTVVAWGTAPPSTVGMTNIVAIRANEFPLVALRADGKVVSAVTPPANLSNVVAVAAGRYNGMALKSDGTVTNWDGGPITPVNLTNVSAIASSQEYCLAILGNGPQSASFAISNLSRGSNSFSVSVPSLYSHLYWLQYKRSLTDSTWQTLPLNLATGSSLTLTDGSATNSSRFYRVWEW